LWILGNHRLLCGDSTILSDVERLMGGQLADMAFTDPPYNVDYGNSAKDKMRGKDRRIMNDDLGEGFFQFLYDSCLNLLLVTKGACYVCMSSSELHTLQKAWIKAGGKWSTFIIWAKNTFTLGRADYQRQYEPILYGWKQGTDHFWCGDRDQSDIWNYNKPRVNDLHPTMKPVELVERAIKNSSKSRDIVLDLFGGSGTTLIASEKTGRQARLIELDPKFVDVIIKRWEDYTGQQAVREDDGVKFGELAISAANAQWQDAPAVANA
jgi:DNA modification methylase